MCSNGQTWRGLKALPPSCRRASASLTNALQPDLEMAPAAAAAPHLAKHVCVCLALVNLSKLREKVKKHAHVHLLR